MCWTFWKDSQHALWHFLLVGEGSEGVAGCRWGSQGQEIPVCVPLKMMSKTEAEEMRVTGDPSKPRTLNLPSVEWGPTVPKLSGDKGSASCGGWTVEQFVILFVKSDKILGTENWLKKCHLCLCF